MRVKSGSGSASNISRDQGVRRGLMETARKSGFHFPPAAAVLRAYYAHCTNGRCEYVCVGTGAGKEGRKCKSRVHSRPQIHRQWPTSFPSRIIAAHNSLLSYFLSIADAVIAWLCGSGSAWRTACRAPRHSHCRTPQLLAAHGVRGSGVEMLV